MSAMNSKNFNFNRHVTYTLEKQYYFLFFGKNGFKIEQSRQSCDQNWIVKFFRMKNKLQNTYGIKKLLFPHDLFVIPVEPSLMIFGAQFQMEH